MADDLRSVDRRALQAVPPSSTCGGHSRGSALYRALLCFAVLLAACLLPLPGADGRIAHLPDICPFHRLTGLPCPGCGLTRSLVCLMHGRWAESRAYHPLGGLVAATLAACCLASVAEWSRGAARSLLPARLSALLPVAGIGVFLIVWAARLAGWDALPH